MLQRKLNYLWLKIQSKTGPFPLQLAVLQDLTHDIWLQFIGCRVRSFPSCNKTRNVKSISAKIAWFLWVHCTLSFSKGRGTLCLCRKFKSRTLVTDLSWRHTYICCLLVLCIRNTLLCFIFNISSHKSTPGNVFLQNWVFLTIAHDTCQVRGVLVV